jgi:hypothetical protein
VTVKLSRKLVVKLSVCQASWKSAYQAVCFLCSLSFRFTGCKLLGYVV